MAIERTYNIPLRKEFQKAPKYKRAKKAIAALKEFLSKHMKAEEIKIGRHLNQFIWERGIKNPPHHVKVNVIKGDDNIAKAELFGHDYVELTKEEMEEQAEKAEKEAKKAESKKKKISEKVEKKPVLAKETAEHPEAVKEEEKGEKLVEQLEREESVPQDQREEEEEIKETIKEIKTAGKQSLPNGAQSSKSSDKVPSAHDLAKKKESK